MQTNPNVKGIQYHKARLGLGLLAAGMTCGVINAWVTWDTYDTITGWLWAAVALLILGIAATCPSEDEEVNR